MSLEISGKQLVYDLAVFYTIGKGRETLIIETEKSNINSEIMQRTVTEKQRNTLKEIAIDETKSEHKPLGKNTNIIISYFLNENGNKTGEIRSLKLFDFMAQELTDNEERHLDNLNVMWKLQPSGIILATSQLLTKLRGIIKYKIFLFELSTYFNDYTTIANYFKDISVFHKKYCYVPKKLGDHYKHITERLSDIINTYVHGQNSELADCNIDDFIELDIHLTEKT